MEAGNWPVLPGLTQETPENIGNMVNIENLVMGGSSKGHAQNYRCRPGYGFLNGLGSDFNILPISFVHNLNFTKLR